MPGTLDSEQQSPEQNAQFSAELSTSASSDKLPCQEENVSMNTVRWIGSGATLVNMDCAASDSPR